jgi:hypothetical protein
MPLNMRGNQVKLLRGINNTLLMPRIIHTLPSSICVFQCDFKDIYESRIAFGGLHTVFTHGYVKNGMSASHLRSY